jgi:hypothetical protein
MTGLNRQRTSATATTIEGPDSRIGGTCATQAFVNLSGHEHYYRARGGATLGIDDCTCRR